MHSETRPKYEHAHHVILERLKGGRYPVGGRRLTEGELAGQFDVNRVIIRRVLAMMVQDGYVESKQGSGDRVLTPSPACSAFDDDGRMVFHEVVFRAGSVRFNLSQSARTPRHV